MYLFPDAVEDNKTKLINLFPDKTETTLNSFLCVKDVKQRTAHKNSTKNRTLLDRYPVPGTYYRYNLVQLF